MNEKHLTEAEIRLRAFEYVSQELAHLTYESYDLDRLAQEDLEKLVAEVRKISRWFWQHKEELMKRFESAV